MNKENQIDEMAKVLEGVPRWEEARLGYYRSKAVALYNAGYRKASEVVDEFIRLMIDNFGVNPYDRMNFDVRDLVELKKKYIGKDTNVTTNTEGK